MSSSAVKAAFEKQIVVLPIDIIVPQKEITTGHRNAEFLQTANRLAEAHWPD